MNPMNFGVPPLPPQMPSMIPTTQPQLQAYHPYPRQPIHTFLYDGPPGFAPISPIYAHPRPVYHVRSAPYFQPPPTHRNLMPPTPDQVYGPSSMLQPFQFPMAPQLNYQPFEQPRYYGPSPPMLHPWNIPMPQQLNQQPFQQQIALPAQSRYYGPHPPVPHQRNYQPPPYQQFFSPPIQFRYSVPPPPMPHPQFPPELPLAVPASNVSPEGIQYHYMDLPLPLPTDSALLNVDQSGILNNVNAFRITSDDETKQESRPSTSEPPTKQKKADPQGVPSQLPASSSKTSNIIQQHQSSKNKKKSQPKPRKRRLPQNSASGANPFHKFAFLPTIKLIDYPRFFKKALTTKAPEFGTIDAAELQIHHEINSYSKQYDKIKDSDYFNYFYFCVETLGDLRTLTFERFVAALAYDGKGRNTYKPRYLDHFGELLKFIQQLTNSGPPKKLIVLNELTMKKGVIVFVAKTFVNESMALCFENSVIQLIKEQLSNTANGQFRGLEVDKYGNKLYPNGPYKKANPKKFVVTENQRRIYGFRNLYGAYQNFILQNHFVIKKSNVKEVYGNPSQKLINECIDQNEITAIYNFFTKSDYSPQLENRINGQKHNEIRYEQLSNVFKKEIPEKCFVFLIFDGSKLSKFGKTTNCNISFREFLNAIVCIGFSNNFHSVYNYTEKASNKDDIFNETIQKVIEKKEGLFIQSLFTMASEKEALLRKSTMLGMLQNGFLKNLDIQKLKDLALNCIENEDDIVQLGIGSLYRFWKGFVGQPPSRLHV